MYEIKLRRIAFTTDADVTLKMMKARTGLTPNILCRLALTLSLDEPGIPRSVADEEKSQREINRYTLFGEHDTSFMALAKTRFHADGIDPEEAESCLIAHIHRGISLLPSRVKSIADVAVLVPPSVVEEALT